MKFNPLDHPISLVQPLRLVFPGPWVEHIPFAMFLTDILRPRLFVELGAHRGNSYCAFCQAIKELNIDAKCFAVDTWEGDEQSGYYGPEILVDLRAHHDPHYGDFSRLVQSTFDEAVKSFSDGSIDLLHIDGLHTYEAVKNDFETWFPKLSQLAVVVFHDTNVRERDFGVWKFWEEVRQKYPHFEFIHGHGLGVLYVGSEPLTPELGSLFLTTEQDTKLIRKFFFSLGARLSTEVNAGSQVQDLGKRLNQQEQTLQQQEQTLDELARQQEQTLQELGRQVAISKEQLKTWELRWADLQSGMAWKLIQKIRDIYHAVAPFGSRQDRWLRSVVGILAGRGRQGSGSFMDRVRSRPGGKAKADGTAAVAMVPNEPPKVSIVIPVFNALDLTKQCIESIYRETRNIAFEVIVINNASQDGTEKWLKSKKGSLDNFEAIHLDQNIGFGPAVNVGIQNSKGKYIVILNNDTIVAPHWLDNLLAAFEQNGNIGIASPMTNYVGEGPQIDQDAVNLPPEVNAIQKYAESIQDRSDLYFEPNRLVFFCVMLRRDLVDIVGYLDTSYEKGNFEDDDYCLRARIAGYQLAIVKNSFVYHLGSATFTKNKISHVQYMEQNRRLFYEKAGRIATSIRRQPAHLNSGSRETSVIIRTLNRPLLLRNALTSLANQTSQCFEAIVVNDGGEDVSGLLDEFRPFYPIEYIFHPTSKGRSASANIGMGQSQGRWIAFLDDDDILYPWHFESLLQAAQQSGCKFVYGDYNRVLFLTPALTTPDKLVGAAPWEFKREKLLSRNFLPIHTWLFARECIDRVGTIDENIDRLEDYDFLLKMSANYPFHHLRKVTCEYRYYLHSPNSIYTDVQKALDALQQIYKRHPTTDAQVIYDRAIVLKATETQRDRIEKIKREIGDELSEQEAQRQIMELVIGL